MLVNLISPKRANFLRFRVVGGLVAVFCRIIIKPVAQLYIGHDPLGLEHFEEVKLKPLADARLGAKYWPGFYAGLNAVEVFLNVRPIFLVIAHWFGVEDRQRGCCL